MSGYGSAAQVKARTDACRPFLKWAGGKRQLLPQLLSRIPHEVNGYFEPFIGGGALFFAAFRRFKRAVLSDINPELINAYLAVRDHPQALIRDLRKHRYDEEYYYALRDADRSRAFARWGSVRRAARLIFLNKTCYNGLYRVNSQGYFNVPFGRYVDPVIYDADNIMACSRALKDARIMNGSFDQIAAKARRGDFVYFDPPFAPLSKTASFTSYTKFGFNDQMQIALRDLCRALDNKGVRFMVSNSSASQVFEIYSDFFIERVPAARAINSNGHGRGKIDEVIVRNYR
ncbi:MAG: DNA adenine methylase [Deltaproteobacteria bacterium]|nr:DNA adenine methylase [Deltaproteobacteria bacterium]